MAKDAAGGRTRQQKKATAVRETLTQSAAVTI